MPADAGELDAYIRVTVDFPPVAVDRKPLNLALVIDRSGSMSGQPIEAAKVAAQTAVGMLLPGDWVAVVAFDGTIEVPVPLTRVGQDRRELLDAIATIGARGSTDLYGGWAEGLSQLMTCPASDVVSRVVILSDGRANQGVTDVPTIAADVSQAVAHKITTSAMGLAGHYDENLLRSVADAGQGNYVFLEGPEWVVEAFEHELAGLGALRGRNVSLSATGQGVGLRRNDHAPAGGPPPLVGETGMRLPDLLAGLPIELVATLTVTAGAKDPGLLLSWDDAVTGQPDSVALALPLEPVDAATFHALPVDANVAERLIALQLAAIKLSVGQAARAGDMARARLHLGQAETLVTQLPAGETLTTELRELTELKSRIRQQDLAMTARYSEKFARDRLYSRSDRSMREMSKSESEGRRQKLEAIAALRASTGPARATTTTPVPASRSSTPQLGTFLYAETFDRPGRQPVNLEVVQGDITSQVVDAIVNSSSRGLFGTSGVDGAIHRGAGPALTAATRSIGSIGYGEAVFTSGYDLPARYVIHTATPAWGATGRELQLLAQCYEAVFALADRLGVRSLALPAIGTGNYGYPVAEATRVAATVASGWLTAKGSFATVRIVVLDPAIGQAYVDEISTWR